MSFLMYHLEIFGNTLSQFQRGKESLLTFFDICYHSINVYPSNVYPEMLTLLSLL